MKTCNNFELFKPDRMFKKNFLFKLLTIILASIPVFRLQAQQKDATVCAEVGDRSVVNIRVYNGNQYVAAGSGVVVSDHIVVTNYHVIQNGQNIYVYKNQNVYYATRILYANSREDLAILQIKEHKRGYDLIPICLGNSDDIKKGETVYAIGNSLGLYANDNRISQGIISTNRKDMIETSAPIQHGNSGGALINAKCQLIGIVTAIWEDKSNMGLAIPVNLVKRRLRRLHIPFRECEYQPKDDEGRKEDKGPIPHRDDDKNKKKEQDPYDNGLPRPYRAVWNAGVVFNLQISFNSDVVNKKENEISGGHSNNTRPQSKAYAIAGDTVIYSLQRPFYTSLGLDVRRKTYGESMIYHFSMDLLSLKEIPFHYLILGTQYDELWKDGKVEIWGFRPGISVEWKLGNLLSVEGGMSYFVPYGKRILLGDYIYGSETSFFPVSYVDGSGFDFNGALKFNLAGKWEDSYLVIGFDYDMAPSFYPEEKTGIQSVGKQMIMLRYVYYFND